MAKKEKNSNPEVERLLRDLYREDVERVSRGESAVYFGHLNDKPLIDEHPEFDWLTRMVPIPVRRPTTRLSLIDDAVDLYERTSRTGATLPEINKRVGEFIRGLGDRMPGAIGSAWRGIFDFSQHSPDKGVAGSAFLPMSVIQREENARREANGEYPLGYVSAVDFIWPREKYGTPWDKRTPEEVRQWEIEHGTRNAAEVELPNVDVYPRDRMDDGGKHDNGWSWVDVEGVLGDAGRSYFVDRNKLSNLVKSSPANFVARLYDKDRKTIPDWKDPEVSVSTHKLGWEYGDDGRIYVFPFVQEIDGELKDFSDPKYGIPERMVTAAALESAISHNDYIVADSPVDAFWITDNYKTLFPGGKDYEDWGNPEKKSAGGNVGPVKVRGFSARIDTGARPIPVSGNYVEDPRRDANSDVSEMERLRDIYDYLRNNDKHKFNDIQALAITANIAAESRGRIDAVGKAGDFGLQQWLGVRKSELQRRHGKNPTMEQQLDYLIDEYLGSINGLGWNYTNRGNFFGSDRNGNKYNYYMYSKKEFDDATSYLDATVAWNQGFGRPLGSTLRNDDRRDIAKRLAEAWGVDDGEYKGYIYGMMGDDGKYEYDPERTQPPIETVVPSQGNNRVDSWWDKNGDDFMRSVLSQAGATRDMMEKMMARAEADEASKREIAKQQAEVERDNLRKQVAMSLVQGMRLDIPGMARNS